MLRRTGFDERINVVREWKDGAEAHASGYNSDGRQLWITVYDEGTESDLDAYVDNP